MRRIWWAIVALTSIIGVTISLNACANTAPPPTPPLAISDKGTPYDELLIPGLQTSVTDGAVGVSVEAPVTIKASSGVLGAVTLTGQQDRVVKANWPRTA